MYNKIKSILLLVCCCSLIACTKTEDLPALPNSKILAYTLPLNDGDIIGAIDQEQRTITLYLPYYNELEIIEPKITVEKGATLVDPIMPISVLDSTVTYTVRGADKTTNTYRLKIVVQQPGTPLKIQELSSENTVATYGVGDYNVQLLGVFNTSDIEKIQAFLVDTQGKETALIASSEFSTAFIRVIYNSVTKQKDYSFGDLRIPPTTIPGSYTIKIKVRGASAETKYPIKVAYKRPDVAYRSQTLNAGEALVIKSNGNIFRGFNAFTLMVGGKKVSCPIENYSATEATIRIPKDIPAGRYYPTVAFEGYPEQDQYWSLTVK